MCFTCIWWMIRDDYVVRSTTNFDRLKALGIKNYGEVIGHDAGSLPETLSGDLTVNSWDISQYVTKGGLLKVAVQHTGGKNWLNIAWVSIEVDGQEVARDVVNRTYHNSGDPYNISYFDLENYSPESEIVCKVNLRGTGTFISNIAGARLLVLGSVADVDSDDMPDTWEIANGLNPVLYDKNGNLDGDRYNNWAEYMMDTLVDDNSSYLALSIEPAPDTGEPTMRFDTSADRNYTVEYSDDLSAESWQNHGSTFSGSGSEVVLTLPTHSSKRFYRLRVELP